MVHCVHLKPRLAVSLQSAKADVIFGPGGTKFVCLGAVAKVGGMTVGVTVGCLLGMVPCLWLEPHSRAQPCPA